MQNFPNLGNLIILIEELSKNLKLRDSYDYHCQYKICLEVVKGAHMSFGVLNARGCMNSKLFPLSQRTRAMLQPRIASS